MIRRILFACIFLAIATVVKADDDLTTGIISENPSRWQFTEWESQKLPSDEKWWKRFGDPVLDSLISMGEDANYDVVMAMKRMDAAARQITVAKASYYPSVDLTAGYTRARTEGVTGNTYSLEGNVNWQIDLFGKITAAVRQKKAAFRASRAQWVGTMVSMAAQIADTYTNLRMWQNELYVAQEQSQTQDSVLQLVKARYEAGLEAHMQVAQAAALTASTNASIPGLMTSIRSAENALALLVARTPEEIRGMVGTYSPVPESRQLVPRTVGADLLRRRPDIVEAEANLASAACAVGIAKKDFLPTLTLTGSVGVSAPKPSDMFTSRGFGYAIAPTLSWTLFDGMARRAGVAAARDEMEAMLASYNETVQTAFNEVDNASTAYANSLKAISYYETASRCAAEFLVSSLELYTQGLISYSDVATAQRSYLSYTNSVIAARGSAVSALVGLYKSLGGGFEE